MPIVTSQWGSDRAFSKNSTSEQSDISGLVMDTADSKWASGILFASKQWYTVFIHERINLCTEIFPRAAC